MNFGIILIVAVILSCYECASIHPSQEVASADNEVAREESLLAAPPDTDALSEDDDEHLDRLMEVQNETLEQTVKEKRCKIGDANMVGRPRLSLGRRDTSLEIFKRNCVNCQNSPMCKNKGRCDGCAKICAKSEAYERKMQTEEATGEDRVPTELVGVASRIGNQVEDQGGLSYGENRYYTVGSFPPGPVHSLLAKMLNIKDVEPIEQLVVLAKTKSPQPMKSVRPVVIDIAHVFSLNHGHPSKLDVEVHEVGRGDGSANSIASMVDKEIEKAMKEKQRTLGTSHLSPSEIDNIIMRAIGGDPKKARIPDISTRNMNEQGETVGCEDKDEDDDDDVYMYYETHDGPQYRQNENGMEEESPKKQRMDAGIPSEAGDSKFERIVAKSRTPQERKQIAIKPSQRKIPMEKQQDTSSLEPKQNQEIQESKIESGAQEEKQDAQAKGEGTQEGEQKHKQESMEKHEEQDQNHTQNIFTPTTEAVVTPTKQIPLALKEDGKSTMSLNKENHQPSEDRDYESWGSDEETSEESDSSRAMPSPKPTMTPPKTPISDGKISKGSTDEDMGKQRKFELEQQNSMGGHEGDINHMQPPRDPSRDEIQEGHRLVPSGSQQQSLEPKMVDSSQSPNQAGSQPSSQSNPPANGRNLDNSNEGMMSKLNIGNSPADPQVSSHYIVGNEQDTPADVSNRFPNDDAATTEASDSTLTKQSYEDKYNKLKDWVMHNTPQWDGVKGIIDTVSKINKDISSMVETDPKNSDLVEMVRGNGEKLRDMERDRNEHIISLPNMNQFKTQVSPDTQRKIDDIFMNDRPVGRQRMSKDPYDTHPRKFSDYKNGKWSYHKAKSSRPAFSAKHRGMDAEEDQPMTDGNVSSDGKARNPAFIDPKLLNMESVMKSLEETPRMEYDKGNKMIGVKEFGMDEGPFKTTRKFGKMKRIKSDMLMRNRQNAHHEPMLPREEIKQSESDGTTNNPPHQSPPDPQRTQEETNSGNLASTEDDSGTKNETVACSKEEEEEMIEVLHHALPGGYRSSEHGESNEGSFAHPKLLPPMERQHHATTAKSHGELEDSIKHITDQTQEMIQSLNKKHKHGKTARPSSAENFQDKHQEARDNQEQFMQPMNDAAVEPGQYPNLPPPEEIHRYAVPSYDESMRMAPEIREDAMNSNFMNDPMMMGQNLIAAPLMRNRIQEPYHGDVTHMGKIVPRSDERPLSIHSRDVSEQEKIKNMYFIGDGIKLPLNMKEHDDGSLHLSVDVKSLCNCKHCTERQLENGTIIVEAMPMTEEEQREHEAEMKEIIENNVKMSANNDEVVGSEEQVWSEEMDNLEEQKDDLNMQEEGGKTDIAKRSPRTKYSLGDNEIEPEQSNLSEEVSIPLINLSRQEILNRLTNVKDDEDKTDGNREWMKTDNQKDNTENMINPRLKLFTNVLDFMKRLALDVQSKK